MSTYVIADIHGCYDEFQQLLAKAGVDLGKDELIIAGDIVDRGEQSLEMLRFLESHPENVTFLKGNHDEDFQIYCRQLVSMYRGCGEDLSLCEYAEKYRNRIYWQIYDNYGTVMELCDNEEVNIDDFERWHKLFKEMEYVKKVEIDGRKYIIVHAGYINDDEYGKFCEMGDRHIMDDIRIFYVWAREDGLEYGGEDGVTIVFGHTPTIIKDNVFYNKGKAKIIEKGKRRFINIDCGGVFNKSYPIGNFCLLRLDDEKFFYLYDEEKHE